MRKLAAAVAGFLVSLGTSSSAQAQAKPAAVPTLSAPSMLVFGAVLGVAALLVQRRKR
jgi:hypothetical protein